jgi:hypothetical protein
MSQSLGASHPRPGAVVIGLLLLGIATVIRTLCEIEHHLKRSREESTEAETAREEKLNISSVSAG